jgi:protein-disulfide isomerase
MPTAPIALEGAATLGGDGARVGVIIYSDFECPFCRTFSHETLPKVTATYVESGKALIAFRHFPLETIHRSARRAAEAAECARRQGKFWEIHDLLFAAARVSDIDFARLVVPGLDEPAFRGCLEGQAQTAVQRDISEARSFGIRGTPTFVFGLVDAEGRLKPIRRESGAIPFESIAAILDELVEGRAADQSARR